jgi:hypothetical protein
MRYPAIPLSTRLDEISCPWVLQSEPFFDPFGPPGRPRDPLPPSNCAKTAATPPPLRTDHAPPCAAAWRPGWATASPKPKKKLRRKIEGSAVQDSDLPRHTALEIPRRAPCRNSVRLVVGWSPGCCPWLLVTIHARTPVCCS